MNIIKTGFSGLFILEPKVFKDERGYFFESFNNKIFTEAGINVNFIQINESRSISGVLRGLHYQLEPYAQTKLIRVVLGEILDVVVDIRNSSPTYGKWFKLLLSEDNKKQLLIPKGFAHGFTVKSPTAIVLYKTDNLYHPESERGIIYNDKSLNIDWETGNSEIIISEKDKMLPLFGEAEKNFVFNSDPYP